MRMEVITRTERKRRYSDTDRARLMAECDAPGSSVIKVAARHDMATSVLHRWRLERKRAQAKALLPMQFVSFGEIEAIDADAKGQAEHAAPRLTRDYSRSSAATARPANADAILTDAEPPLLPHPGGAPGTIAIALTSGVRVSVDSYVNEKALHRVLKTLKLVA
jgi:transposase-like protein